MFIYDLFLGRDCLGVASVRSMVALAFVYRSMGSLAVVRGTLKHRTKTQRGKLVLR